MSLPYTLRQLDRLCADHPLTPKILLVPGVRAGYDLTTALARTGTAWTDLRVTTPAQLAAEELGPQMAARGVRRLPRRLGPLLVEAILARWPAAERAYFPAPPPAGEASLARSLQATLEALRLHGVLPEHLADLPRADRGADLAYLLRAYGEALARQGWWDTRDLVVEAMALPSEHAPETRWVVLDETDLPGLVADYVRQRAGDRLQRLGRPAYGVRGPVSSASVRCAAAPLLESPTTAAEGEAAPAPPRRARRSPGAAARLVQGDLFLDGLRDDASEEPAPRGLFATVAAAPSRPDIVVAPGGRLLTTGLTVDDADSLRLWETVGLETEVRAVLRDILADGLPLDDVEVVYTAATPYRDLLHDAAARWELPVDEAAGMSAALTPPGRQLVSFLEWVAGGLDGLDLAARLRGGTLGWRGAPAASRVARWLAQGRAGAGRDEVLAALARLEPPPRRDGEEPDSRDETQRERLEQAAARLQELFDFVPAQDEPTGLVDGALRFLRGLEAGDGEAGQERAEEGGDERAAFRRRRDELAAHLTELRAAVDLPGDRATHARRLLDGLRHLRVDAGRAQPGRLRIAPLAQAGYSGRRHLYVVGLDESRFPGSTQQDAVLLDDERRRLSPDLPLAADRASEAVFHLIRVLGSAAGRATLVCSRLHLADGREPWPTPLFEQARLQLGRTAAVDWEPPVAAADRPPTDALEGLLARRQLPGLRTGLAAAFPGVWRGFTARRARAAPSRFSGWIGGHGDERLDREGRRTLSSRMLETMAECPRRYLLRDGLGLRAPEEPPRDPRRWLQPLEMGNLLHGLFLDFMGQLGDGERPGAEHEERLTQMVAQAIERERQRVPVVLEAAFRADRRRIERAARIFLHAEAERLAADPALTPYAFELDFGLAGGAEGAPGAEAPTIELAHDVTFRLRGRVDRIDAVRDGEGRTVAYEVWDYKTGSTYHFSATDLLRGGRILQWALYAHALPEILPEAAPVRLSGYFFASDRGSGQRFHDAPPARHELADRLRPLFDLARQGYFPALHKGDEHGGGACRFCDFQRVCADEARGEREVEDLVDTAAQLAGLVEGWAEVAVSGRTGSRRSIESTLADVGLAPGDVAPEEAVRPARDWIRT